MNVNKTIRVSHSQSYWNVSLLGHAYQPHRTENYCTSVTSQNPFKISLLFWHVSLVYFIRILFSSRLHFLFHANLLFPFQLWSSEFTKIDAGNKSDASVTRVKIWTLSESDWRLFCKAIKKRLDAILFPVETFEKQSILSVVSKTLSKNMW